MLKMEENCADRDCSECQISDSNIVCRIMHTSNAGLEQTSSMGSSNSTKLILVVASLPPGLLLTP